MTAGPAAILGKPLPLRRCMCPSWHSGTSLSLRLLFPVLLATRARVSGCPRWLPTACWWVLPYTRPLTGMFSWSRPRSWDAASCSWCSRSRGHVGGTLATSSHGMQKNKSLKWKVECMRRKDLLEKFVPGHFLKFFSVQYLIQASVMCRHCQPGDSVSFPSVLCWVPRCLGPANSWLVRQGSSKRGAMFDIFEKKVGQELQLENSCQGMVAL